MTTTDTRPHLRNIAGFDYVFESPVDLPAGAFGWFGAADAVAVVTRIPELPAGVMPSANLPDNIRSEIVTAEDGLSVALISTVDTCTGKAVIGAHLAVGIAAGKNLTDAEEPADEDGMDNLGLLAVAAPAPDPDPDPEQQG